MSFELKNRTLLFSSFLSKFIELIMYYKNKLYCYSKQFNMDNRDQVPWIFSGPNLPVPKKRAEKETLVKKSEPKVQPKVESKKKSKTQASQGENIVL